MTKDMMASAENIEKTESVTGVIEKMATTEVRTGIVVSILTSTTTADIMVTGHIATIGITQAANTTDTIMTDIITISSISNAVTIMSPEGIKTILSIC